MVFSSDRSRASRFTCAARTTSLQERMEALVRRGTDMVLSQDLPRARIPAQYGIVVPSLPETLGPLVPAHGLVKPFVGGRAGPRAVPAQRGSRPSLADDAGVVGPVVLALQRRKKLPRILHARSPGFAELIRPREEKQDQCLLVARFALEHVQADALRLQR